MEEQKTTKKLEILEKKIELEIGQRKDILKIMEQQQKLLDHILKK